MANWNDLLIKGVNDSSYQNGYDVYKVRMGKGFIDAIEAPTQLKEPIENDSRLEDGVRMLISTKKAKRTVSLQFNIFGSSISAYMNNKAAFEAMLYGGMVSIKVNDTNHPNYYHLVYTGKSVSYKHSYNGRFGIITCQFIEPNPANRTAAANEKVKLIG